MCTSSCETRVACLRLPRHKSLQQNWKLSRQTQKKDGWALNLEGCEITLNDPRIIQGLVFFRGASEKYRFGRDVFSWCANVYFWVTWGDFSLSQLFLSFFNIFSKVPANQLGARCHSSSQPKTWKIMKGTTFHSKDSSRGFHDWKGLLVFWCSHRFRSCIYGLWWSSTNTVRQVRRFVHGPGKPCRLSYCAEGILPSSEGAVVSPWLFFVGDCTKRRVLESCLCRDLSGECMVMCPKPKTLPPKQKYAEPFVRDSLVHGEKSLTPRSFDWWYSQNLPKMNYPFVSFRRWTLRTSHHGLLKIWRPFCQWVW